ncbi:MAG: HAMP domain-containing sensor histidine kinase [Bacteroidota bacterium]
MKSLIAIMQKNKRPFLLFYLLVFYVLIQFAWWSYLLFSLNSEVYVHKTESILLSSYSPADTSNKQNILNAKLNNRLLMIAGEGMVFLIILIYGISRVKKGFQKELEINKQQKNFLLSVTHELKSPIASARLQLETLLKRDLDKTMQTKILNNALADTQRLNDLVEKILQATRIESANVNETIEEINISELTAFLIENFKNNSNTKQNFTQNIQENILLATTNDDWVFMVNNLIENAIKYSPSNSQITLELVQNEDTISLKVCDEGEEIPEEEKEKITEKFYRIGNEETRNTKGTGLGLYIVKSLVEKYYGQLHIKKNEPKGNVFEIIFPNNLSN